MYIQIAFVAHFDTQKEVHFDRKTTIVI